MRRIPLLAWLLVVVGLLFVVLGVIYLTIVAPDLPSFIPGSVDHKVTRERTYNKRGIAALVVAAAAFAGAWFSGFRLDRFRSVESGEDDAG